MIELEYQNERYMVENGQWFRRLKVGEAIFGDVDVSIDSTTWHKAELRSPPATISNRDIENGGHYRVPCPDPRPPFSAGQRVRVARKSGDDYLDQLVGQCGTVTGVVLGDNVDCDFGQVKVYVSIPPWCLDAVTEPT